MHICMIERDLVLLNHVRTSLGDMNGTVMMAQFDIHLHLRILIIQKECKCTVMPYSKLNEFL